MLRPTSRAFLPPDREPILCFIDTETTGLDELRHGVRQISGCIVDTRAEEDEWFDITVKPFPSDEIDHPVMERMGVDVKEFANYNDPIDVFHSLVNRFSEHVDRYNPLDKMVFVGYNAAFDERFIREFWRKADPKEGKYFGSWFFMPVIDVAQMAHLVLLPDRLKKDGPERFSLECVASYMGLEVDEACLHDALYDVELTRELYNVVLRRLAGT